MKDISIDLIGHNNSVNYFREFFKEHTAAQLGYQLQRMFEQGSAIYGDYFLVKIDKKPFMIINGDRTNCKRVFTSDIHFTLDSNEEYNKENFPAAISEVLQFILDDEIYTTTKLTLEFEAYNCFSYNKAFKDALEIKGFTKHRSYSEFEVKINSDAAVNFIADIEVSAQTKKITELPLEDRYQLFSQYDNHVCLLNKCTPIEDIYKDYIETGIKSEALWELILNERNEELALMLPVIENTAYKQLRVVKYLIMGNNTDRVLIFNTILKKAFSICDDERYNG